MYIALCDYCNGEKHEDKITLSLLKSCVVILAFGGF